MRKMSKEAREVVAEARRLLARPGGWTQGAFRDNLRYPQYTYPAMCLSGALSAAGIDILSYQQYDAIYDHVRAVIFDDPTNRSIIGWNDDYGRRKKDVLDALDRVLAS